MRSNFEFLRQSVADGDKHIHAYQHKCDSIHITAVFFSVLAAVMFMYFIPFITEAVLVTDMSVSGKLDYSAEDVAAMIEQLSAESDNKLEETVFGEQYSTAVLKAMDARAYTEALEAEQAANKVYEEEQLAKAFYIKDVTLEYPWEDMEMSYDMQKFIYEQCEDLDLDYWLVMGIIARESRFNANALGYNNGIYYYGYMQMDWTCVETVRKWLNNDTLDPTDPYDNIVIGTHILRNSIDEAGSEYGGVFAYGVGMGAYMDSIKAGIYTNASADRAYKYRDMLMHKERFTAEVAA